MNIKEKIDTFISGNLDPSVVQELARIGTTEMELSRRVGSRHQANMAKKYAKLIVQMNRDEAKFFVAGKGKEFTDNFHSAYLEFASHALLGYLILTGKNVDEIVPDIISKALELFTPEETPTP